MSTPTNYHDTIELCAQAAALCSQASGRLEQQASQSNLGRAADLLEAQWADTRLAWSNPLPGAFKLADTTMRTLERVFPNDHPRTLLEATAALLNGRAKAMEGRS